MRKLAFALAFVAPVYAAAQAPDVFFRVDANLHYRTAKDGGNTLRWYDSLGRHSTVGVSLTLEPGFRAFVSERLQRIPNDGDPEQLDEYYIEDPGLWRVGKQYLPFGKNRFLNESGRGARGETNLLFENLPIVAAITDNGEGRPRGVIGRIGSRVGVSFALGDNFGIQSTSLTLVRKPEDAPGKGRGHRLVVGVDGSKRIGNYDLAFEAATFRNGHTALDTDKDVSDLAVSLAPDRYRSVTLGWTRDWSENQNFFRAQARIFVANHIWVEPLVRMRGSEFYDLGVSVRVKL